MSFIDRKFDPFILEYSFLIVFICYLIGLSLFLVDLILFGFRQQFDVIILDFSSSNTSNQDFRITKPIFEFIIVFVFYLIIFTWLAIYEWYRRPNLEFQIISDKNGNFKKFYNFMTKNFPNIPVDLTLEKIHLTNPRLCFYNNFWYHLKSTPKYDFNLLIPFFVCTLAQWIVIFFSHFFVTGKISFSYLEILAFCHSFFHWGFGFLLLFLFLINIFIIYRTKIFYSQLKTGIFEFLINEKKISIDHAKFFIGFIGFNGLVYLTKITDLAGFSYFEYALIFMIQDFYLHFNAKKAKDFENSENEDILFSDFQDKLGKSGAYELYDALRNDNI